MFHRNRSILSIATLAVLALALAACGGGDDDSGSDQTSATNATAGSTPSSAAGGSTVSVKSIGDVAKVLVDAEGDALYTNDRDTGSMVACTGECAAIWIPLEAPSGAQPTSDDSSVEAELGVVELPDGGSQVTYEGKPLYTFVQDGPAEATGDGVSDSFGGTDFTWTVASAGGDTPTGSGGGGETTTSDDSGSEDSGYESGGSGGGYGY